MAKTLVAIFVIGFTLMAGAHAQSFVDGLEDLPLAPGLAAVTDAGLVFDSPSGRIVESFATGPVGREQVLRFYKETLPALGWEWQQTGRYTREGENLSIDFFGADGSLSVRFTLAPE